MPSIYYYKYLLFLRNQYETIRTYKARIGKDWFNRAIVLIEE